MVLAFKDGELHIESVAISKIATQVPTPFYVYSQAKIVNQYNRLAAALQDIDASICYAVKANSNIAILKLLESLGAGADIVSGGELQRCLAAGIEAKKIVFSGVGKQKAEIIFALKSGIKCFNVESSAELFLIEQCAIELGVLAPISLRVNPDVDANTHAKISTGKAEDKFGIDIPKAKELYNYINNSAHLLVTGVDMHIGSQITKAEPFESAFIKLYDFINELKADNIIIQHIDIGGGLGIPYEDDAEILEVEDYALLIKKYLMPLGLPIVCEPGRFLVGEAGLLVTSVIYTKAAPNKNFIIVDAAMNDLMRPTLYEAKHKMLTIKQPEEPQTITQVDIVGPVCETGDFLAKDIEVPQILSGDLLAFLNAGAYGATMSSSYNSRPLIAEILVSEAWFAPIRKSVSVEEMLQWETLPAWL